MSTAPPINRPKPGPPPGPKPRPPGLAAKARGGVGKAAAAVIAGPQRATLLAVIAVVIGLACAGYGLVHPAAREATTTPPGVVALVNGEPVLMTDYVEETQEAMGTPFAMISPADKAKGLRDMIDQELMVQRALALDLPEQDTNVRSALGDSVTALVTAPVAGKATGTLAAPPTDAQLEAYFNKHKANYATRGSMILTDLVLHYGSYENIDQSLEQAMADAQQASYELQSGANLDYVKDHFGLVDSGKAVGELPDFSARLHLGDKVYNVAQAMTDGQISAPIDDKDGVHILIMNQRKAPVFYDYASVKNNVYTDYVTDQKNKAKADNLVFLRRNAKILIAPGYSE